MPYTIESALNDDAIERVERTYEGFSIWLKGIPTEIKISIYVNGLQGGFNYTLSHVIKTPVQMQAYHSSRQWGDDIAYALHQAVSAITMYYKTAVDKGHEVSSDWLVEN